MDKNEHINKLIHNALNSADDVSRATAKPYLLTRINARLQSDITENFWDVALKFISKPAIAFASIAIVIAINVFVFSNSINEKNTATTIDDQSLTAYDYISNVAVINNIENQEP